MIFTTCQNANNRQIFQWNSDIFSLRSKSTSKCLVTAEGTNIPYTLQTCPTDMTFPYTSFAVNNILHWIRIDSNISNSCLTPASLQLNAVAIRTSNCDTASPDLSNLNFSGITGISTLRRRALSEKLIGDV